MTTHTHTSNADGLPSRESVLFDYERPLPRRSTYFDTLADLLANVVAMADRRPNPNVTVEVLADAFRSVDVDDLAAAMERYDVDVDDLANYVGRMVRVADDDAYFDVDPSLYRLDPERFDPTWTRPRRETSRGIAVTGARHGSIITTHAGHVPYVVALRMANDFLRANVDTRVDFPTVDPTYDFDLIGTDTYSWAQVVDHKPDTRGVVDVPERVTRLGRVIPAHTVEVFARPSVVAGAGDARKPRQYRLPRPSYGTSVALPMVDDKGRTLRDANGKVRARLYRVPTMPSEVRYIGAWPFVNVRVVKRYATTYNGRRTVGNGKSTAVSKSNVGRRYVATGTRKRVAVVDVPDFDTLADTVGHTLAAAKSNGNAARWSFRLPNGTTAVVAHDPNRRRFEVAVTNRVDGKIVGKSKTSTKSVTSAVVALGRYVGQ